MTKTKETAEFGDFQTPDSLARNVCISLAKQGVVPASLLEPTCGIGNLLFAGMECFGGVTSAVGVEVNPSYVRQAQVSARHRKFPNWVKLVQGDFFAMDWKQVLDALPEPVLVLGNPPWVTNAHLSSLGSKNLPTKSNFQKRNGMDAITGKANFDISEWMLIQLIEALQHRRGVLAMLCKSIVARKVLLHAWKNELAICKAAIYRINAEDHFNAAVDAVLLVVHFGVAEASAQDASVFSDLWSSVREPSIGFHDGDLIANVDAYQRSRHFRGVNAIKWRSGIKHDCSTVMELSREGNNYRNGDYELVDIEDVCLYPMLKSSQVARGEVESNRYMIVTQRFVGEDTSHLERIAPKTWAYLCAHAERLNRRASSIYRNRPPFSIFGVGDYSFAPWKVAISGFYKKLKFAIIGPVENKPFVLDDTVYFLPCDSNQQAELLAFLLNSSEATDFFNASIFWDGKRPITADVLRRLDLRRIARELHVGDPFESCFREMTQEQMAFNFKH